MHAPHSAQRPALSLPVMPASQEAEGAASRQHHGHFGEPPAVRTPATLIPLIPDPALKRRVAGSFSSRTYSMWPSRARPSRHELRRKGCVRGGDTWLLVSRRVAHGTMWASVERSGAGFCACMDALCSMPCTMNHVGPAGHAGGLVACVMRRPCVVMCVAVGSWSTCRCTNSVASPSVWGGTPRSRCGRSRHVV